MNTNLKFKFQIAIPKLCFIPIGRIDFQRAISNTDLILALRASVASLSSRVISQLLSIMTLQQRACGLVIFRRFQDTIQYLLMQTSYGEHHWTPPKGHVDPDESDMETALRETQEEAGFVSNDLKIFEDARHEMTYRVKGKPKIVIYWLAELLNPEKPVRLSNEHQAFDWLPLREACDRAKYDEMRKALNEFDNYVSRNLS